METDIPPPAGDRATRAGKACLSCRKLKIRCIVESSSQICQKCATSQRTCLWSLDEPKAARKRGPSRLMQMETKLDSLMAQLAPDGRQESSSRSDESLQNSGSSSSVANHGLDNDSRNLASEAPLPNLGSRRGSSMPLTASQIESLHDFGPRARCPFSGSNKLSMDEMPSEKVIWTQLVSDTEAQGLLNKYRPMSASFPFVKLAQMVTASDLRARRPMLLLAILTVSSWRQKEMQASLAEQYRHELATQTIINSKKSIDLVQSLAVHLAWYHHFFSQRTRNVYSLLQLMVGLVYDLDLDKEPVADWRDEVDHNHRLKEEQREQQRTFLGCYFLASSISASLRKPNPIRFTNYITECVERLAKDEEFPSDTKLSALIDTCALHDRVCDLAHPAVAGQLLPNYRSLHNQLCGQYQAMRLRRPFLHLTTAIDFYSLAFRESRQVSLANITDDDRACMTRFCFDSAKAFLDTLLECSTSEYQLISFIEWTNVPQVVLLLSRIRAGPTKHMSRIPESFGAELRLDLYLDSLCYRMQQVTTYNPPTQPFPDFWMSMKLVMTKLGQTNAKRSPQRFPTFLPENSGITFNSTNSLAGREDAQLPELSNGHMQTDEFSVPELELDDSIYIDLDGQQNGNIALQAG